MPNRIIREGWLESSRIDKLDAQGERFFLRLCLKADDFGRYNAAPQLLKSLLFPLKDDLRNTDMSRCLAACEKAGLVRCYEANGKRYLEINNFDQRLRAKVSKFPQMSDACQTHDWHMSDIRRLDSETETEEKRDGRETEAVAEVQQTTAAAGTEDLEFAGMDPHAAFVILEREHPDIDVRGEFNKLKALCEKNGNKPTWRGFLGWLRKASPTAKIPRRRVLLSEGPKEEPISIEEQAELAKELAFLKAKMNGVE